MGLAAPSQGVHCGLRTSSEGGWHGAATSRRARSPCGSPRSQGLEGPPPHGRCRASFPRRCAFCTRRISPASDTPGPRVPRAQRRRGSGRGSLTCPSQSHRPAHRDPEQPRGVIGKPVKKEKRTRTVRARSSRPRHGVSCPSGAHALGCCRPRGRLCPGRLRVSCVAAPSVFTPRHCSQHHLLLLLAGSVPRGTRRPPGCWEQGGQPVPLAQEGHRHLRACRVPLCQSPAAPLQSEESQGWGAGFSSAFFTLLLRNLGFRVDKRTWQSFNNVRIRLWVLS